MQRFNASTNTYSTIKSLTSTSYKDIERVSATVYKYRVRAYKIVNGKRVYGPYSNVANCATDPLKVENLKKRSVSTSYIAIEWSKVARADGYAIYRSTTRDGSYSKIETVTGSNLYYKDEDLSSGKTYYYKVRAYKKADSTNYGSYSNILAATTRPATVTNFAQSSSTTSSITLSWNKDPNVSGYEIRRATSKDGEYKVLKEITKNSITTYTNSFLSSGSKYYYQIRSYKVLDGTTYYSDFSNEIAAACKPSKVTGLKKETSTDTYAKLSWGKVTNASGYQIRRSTSEDGTYSKIGEVSGSSTLTYTDKSVSSGNIYYYKVRAYKSADKTQYGAYSSAVSAVIYPKKVTGLKKILGTSSSTKLSWNKVDSGSGYKIERATSKDGKYTLIKKITNNSTTTYTDTGLTNNKTYYYRIKAYKTISSKEYDGKYSDILTAPCKKFVPVTSISLDKTNNKIKINDEFMLTATIKPLDATDKKIIWKSSNTSVAKVDSTGKVTGVGRGSAIISAVSNFDNKIVATCTVIVNDINADDIFVKQETNYTCTLASAVMLYRRELCLQGKTYDDVNETNLRPYAWTDGQGLNGTIIYKGITAKGNVDIASTSDKKSYLIEILKHHEEGIIIYDYSKPHAVLLTDYDANNDIFYCADPQSDAPKGRIQLEKAKMYEIGEGSTQDRIINHIDHIWYIVK